MAVSEKAYQMFILLDFNDWSNKNQMFILLYFNDWSNKSKSD